MGLSLLAFWSVCSFVRSFVCLFICLFGLFFCFCFVCFIFVILTGIIWNLKGVLT